jgi:hypothetical protein
MSEIFFQSFIDPRQWDSAKWEATAFLHDPEGSDPACMGIVFTDIAAGRGIFRQWRERLGSVDQSEELRVAIIEGEILGRVPGYSVHLSSNPQHTQDRARQLGQPIDAKTAIVISRINRMTPEPNSPHLPRFKQEFAKHRRYFLIPVGPDMEPDFDLSIGKTEVVFRQASEITARDIDSVVFPENYFDVGGSVQ